MPQPRLVFDRLPRILYAVGDVHGCLEPLLELEERIRADARGYDGEKWLVMLGDHVDRGPRSAEVIRHLLASPPQEFTRFCLMGNHERMMLDALEDPLAACHWLDQGGLETLLSYGVPLSALAEAEPAALPELLAASIPATHLDFLRGLPVALSLPGWLFVHAGIRPGLPLELQEDEDLLWIREPFLGSRRTPSQRVVHGHTPSRRPVVTRARIGIDTHCFATGRLTALRIAENESLRFIATGR